MMSMYGLGLMISVLKTSGPILAVDKRYPTLFGGPVSLMEVLVVIKIVSDLTKFQKGYGTILHAQELIGIFVSLKTELQPTIQEKLMH